MFRKNKYEYNKNLRYLKNLLLFHRQANPKEIPARFLDTLSEPNFPRHQQRTLPRR